ncbi:MAG: DNA repair protein RecO [Parvularcula sp.]
MQWSDSGIVIGSRPHGEHHTITRLFTENHGVVSGLLHGGQGKTKGALALCGNLVCTRWNGRLQEQLGHFDLEIETPIAAMTMMDRSAFLGLTYLTELLSMVLPEGQAYPNLFDATRTLMNNLSEERIFPILLVHWEMGLLAQLGYALTLDKCAATGRSHEDGADLVFVSPKSGGAVSYEAGLPYKDRLLPLPPFLIERGEPTIPDVKAAFELTGFFLNERVLFPAGKEMPRAREQFISRSCR